MADKADRLDLLRDHRRRIGEQMALLTGCLALIEAKVTAYGSPDTSAHQHASRG